MRKFGWIVFLIFGGMGMSADKNFFDFETKTLGGKDLPLSEYKNRAVLVVNTASKCGYTKQYEGLEKLYKTYKDQGLVVIGFPSNDFGAQEPGSNEEIEKFCKFNYGVSFPMATKVAVKGDQKTELFKFLTSQEKMSGEIKWNFEKFLIGKDGKVLQRFDSATEPMSESIVSAIKKVL